MTKHLLHLARTEYRSETSAAKQLFEVLKSFKDSYFGKLYACDILEFLDAYDEITTTKVMIMMEMVILV